MFNKPTPEDLWPELAPDWMLTLPEWIHDFFFNFYKCFIYDNRYELMIEGLGNTLLLTLTALLLGVFLGIIVAVVRVTYDKNRINMHGAGGVLLDIANTACKVYLTVIRGTPVMVQLLIIYYVIFASSTNKLMVGFIAFGINSGAYVAEIIRSGIMAVDNGQTEAGRSLGLNYIQTMRYIVIPQAFKAVLPALANEFIVLLKETSVAGYIAMQDLTYAANLIAGNSYEYAYPLISAGVIYLLMVMFFTYWVGRLERRLRNSDH